MELNLNRTFTEKLEDIILYNTLNNEFMKNHLLIFDIENNDRRKILHQTITKENWKKYKKDLHDFDYIYFYGSYFDKRGLYDTFQNFNGKTIIFDNETLLNIQPLIDILEGTICSSPDSGSKWPIRLDGQKEFKFTCSVIILTNQERYKFSKKKKYDYLIRDMMKI